MVVKKPLAEQHIDNSLMAKTPIGNDNIIMNFRQNMPQSLKKRLQEGNHYGPLCTEKAAKDVEAQIKASVDGGATLLLGGQRDGAFIQPTILTDIPKGTPASDDEIFGPVANVFIAKDEADAIRIANDSDFGLGASGCKCRRYRNGRHYC